MHRADLIFEQTNGFEFILRKNRLGSEKDTVHPAGMMNAVFNSSDRVEIVDSKGVVISANFKSQK